MKPYQNHKKDLKVKHIHNVYTDEINKIELSSNDDKRLQTFDRITSYPYGASVGKACKTEILSKYKWLILITI